MCCLTETERPIGLVGWTGGEKYQDKAGSDMNALLQTVKGMSSDIQAVSAAAEQDCKTPAPLIDQLHAEGIFSMTVAKDYGGLELDAVDSLSVIEEIAYQESAVGWCSMIFATTAHLGSFLSPVWGKRFMARVRERSLWWHYRWCGCTIG